MIHECRDVDGERGRSREAQLGADVEGPRGGAACLVRIDAVGYDRNLGRGHAVGREDILDRPGDRDDTIGAAPGAEASDMEVDAAGGHEPCVADRMTGHPECVSVVRVHDVGLELGDREVAPEPCARVQTPSPRRFGDRRAVGGSASRQLAPPLRDEDLLDARLPRQLTAQQAHLVLAAAPLTAGIDLENSQRVRQATSRRRARAVIHPA